MWGKILDITVRQFTPPKEISGLDQLFTGLASRPYAMLLLSGGDLDCAGYSLMGWDPFLVIRAKGRRVEVQQDGDTRVYEADPFVVLEDLLGALQLPGDSPLAPMTAGGLGFLAYDLKNHLERLPTTAVDDLHLPEMVFAFPRRLVIHDRRGGRFWQVGVTYEDAAGPRHGPGGRRTVAPGDSPGRLPGGAAPEQFYPGGVFEGPHPHPGVHRRR